jgi:8-oxo-dGTP pyrophosphatase MutT (NUDIX family)
MALPGGRQDAGDRSLLDTVLRESREEIGVDILSGGAVLGQLDELRPRTPVLPPIVVTPFVAVIGPDVQVVPNEEVAETLWIPWSKLASPAALGEASVQTQVGELRVPAYRIGPHLVWGMTERILSQLLRRWRSES